jgi:class 3 adenylate cyclase/HD superfamily phosphodiesterase
LVIDNNATNISGLRAMLNGSGNNLIFCENEKAALPILKKRKVGIILINIQRESIDGFELLQRLKSNPNSTDAYKIVISESTSSGAKLVKGFREGAVDYISSPFNPNLVKAKIEVFKTLYFKDQRINQLLQNIFPQNVLRDLNTIGKFSPKRIEEGVVLFTDFVAFSKIAKHHEPMTLLRQLEEYFNKFDEIIDRYELEKIKTIGDAYMALGGVTENCNKPAVRACLAALEMRNYMKNRKELAQATGSDFWEIRIGLHSGPLVAGIIGSKKMSFDVWGDTVNIAARAEQHSSADSITVTDRIAGHVLPYFDLMHRGEIEIKYGGQVDMFYLEQLKAEYSLFEEGNLPNSLLRTKCDLVNMDFEFARRHIINKLKSSLPDELDYHNLKHTLNVEKAAERIAKLEGVEGEDLILLKTAVLFHDSGFILKYEHNEIIGAEFVRKELPKFGYNEQQIKAIAQIIMSTTREVEPTTLLEKIMCDADHDYLGRADYFLVSKKLRNELELQGQKMTNLEWVEYQLNYLENVHEFYTDTAHNIRNKGKMKRIHELKQNREDLLNE